MLKIGSNSIGLSVGDPAIQELQTHITPDTDFDQVIDDLGNYAIDDLGNYAIGPDY